MTYPEDNDNTQWLEAARETFEEAVEAQNWPLAEAIIGDTREVSAGSANVLQRELEAKRNGL